MAGKKYLEAEKLVDRAKLYDPAEGISLAKKTAYAGFDETVEVHIRTTLDPRNAEQQLRGVALLPHGLGKKVRILVFAAGEAAKIAQEAGADFVGSDDLIKKVEEGWVDFDIAIATPDIMGKIGKLGKVIGRRGLMPNPKAGTIVPPQDLPRAIQDARKGRIEFKLDRTAIVHVPIGKKSFEDDKLLGNLAALMDAMVKARPGGAKGQFVKTISLSTTMGPGIRLDPAKATALSLE